MKMIDVMTRLAELDAGNPNIVNPTAQLAAEKHAPVTETREPITEAHGNDLRVLAGVKQKKNLTESTIAECGMMPMGAPMPPTMPASINMSAGNAGEIVAMMRGIMDLAKSDVPSQSMMPTMGAPMPKMMGDLDRDGDHDMDDHDMETPDDVLTGGPAVSGPTFGDEGGMDDSGADEIADMIKKIKTGQPVKIKTDMPVKVTSDEPIKGTTDKLNKVSDDGEEKEAYDNTPADPTKVPKFDPNSMADMRNKIDMAEIPPGAPGDNRLPKKKEEESMDPFSAFESKLMSDYKKFVEESEQKTMSRAAKGMMKYGKEGMKALAKAGKEGKDLDKIRDKYDKYDESSHQASTTMKHVKNPTAGEKKAAKDIKPGVKGYADRVAMLKSAEKDGRLK